MEDEPQKIQTWFYNHYERLHRQMIRFTRRWSGQNAFYHENKAQITELTQQISGGVPGSQAFLGALQDATTQLWKKLSSEEQDKYRVLAKEWSDERPPKHIQAKHVTFIDPIFLHKTNSYVQNGICSIQASDSSGLPDPAIQNMWNTFCSASGLHRGIRNRTDMHVSHLWMSPDIE